MTRWEMFVAHKEAAFDVEKRSSLFLGIDPRTGQAVNVPLSALKDGHFHVQGKAGCGKTSATLLSIALQAIRGYRDQDGVPSPKAPVIIFDLKGDHAFFHAIQNAAEQSGRTFRYFSTRSGIGYHYFDPFQMAQGRDLAPMQLAASIVGALNLDYGPVYGGQFFTDMNTLLLKDAIKRLRSEGITLTLQSVSDSIRTIARGTRHKDATHIASILDQLAEYPQINLDAHASEPSNQLHMARALALGEVVFIHFEMQDEATTLRSIAGLQLASLVHAAKYLRAQQRSIPFTYVFIDEFYHIGSRYFGDLLATCRDWNLHFFLANQYTGQLERFEPTLPQAVYTNSSVRQVYTFEDDLSMKQWQRDSGETYRADRSYSLRIDGLGQGTESYGYSEVKDFRLSLSDAQAINDGRLRSLLYVDTGRSREGSDRIQRVQGLHPLSPQKHLAWKDLPLPTTPKYVLKNAREELQPDRDSTVKAKAIERPKAPMNPELQGKLKALWATCERELGRT